MTPWWFAVIPWVLLAGALLVLLRGARRGGDAENSRQDGAGRRGPTSPTTRWRSPLTPDIDEQE